MSEVSKPGLNSLPQEILDMIFDELSTRELLFGPRQVSRRLRQACKREFQVRDQEGANCRQRLSEIAKEMREPFMTSAMWQVDIFQYHIPRIISGSSYQAEQIWEIRSDSPGRAQTCGRLRLVSQIPQFGQVPRFDIDICMKRVARLDQEFSTLMKRGLWRPGTDFKPWQCSCASVGLPYHGRHCECLDVIENGVLHKSSIEEGLAQFPLLKELNRQLQELSHRHHWTILPRKDDSDIPCVLMWPTCTIEPSLARPGCSHIDGSLAMSVKLQVSHFVRLLWSRSCDRRGSKLLIVKPVDTVRLISLLFRKWFRQLYGRLGWYEYILEVAQAAWD